MGGGHLAILQSDSGSTKESEVAVGDIVQVGPDKPDIWAEPGTGQHPLHHGRAGLEPATGGL